MNRALGVLNAVIGGWLVFNDFTVVAFAFFVLALIYLTAPREATR